MMKIAACLLLAVCIGVPVVIASSAEIRSRVYHSIWKPNPTPIPRATIITMEMNWAL